jgi:cytochrome P450
MNARTTTAHLDPIEALPLLPSLPLIQSLPWLLHPKGFMARMHQHAERRGPERTVRVRMPDGGQPIFVGSAALATDVCDESDYEKVLDGPLLSIREFTGDGLFTAHGDEPNWQRAHRLLSPGFSSSSLERSYPAMQSSLDTLVEHWRRASEPVDVVADMTRLTLDTISLAGFDYHFNSLATRDLHPFLAALARAFRETEDVLYRPPFLSFLFRGKRAQFAADIRTMFELVDAVIVERKKKPVAEWPRDFLSLMLTEVDPKSGERLSDENIRYQILTFLLAGHETTSGLLAFTLHELARNPALLARLRAEVTGAIGDRAPTMKEVLGLDLVHRTLSEALRLWPTVPGLTRAARHDTVLAGRYRVPKGQIFVLLLNAIHRDPAVWPDPDRFDPDRFLPEAQKGRPAGAYKPFGVGKRSCTGRHFALIESALCIATLVRAFDFGDPGPLAVAPTLSPKPQHFRLELRPR